MLQNEHRNLKLEAFVVMDSISSLWKNKVCITTIDRDIKVGKIDFFTLWWLVWDENLGKKRSFLKRYELV